MSIDEDAPRPERRAWRDSAWGAAAAFGTYFCMYGFRKPFAAGTFADIGVGALDYKTVLVVSQVLGYATAKFVGIKVIAELSANARVVGLIGVMLAAEGALLLFGLVPPPYSAACLFLNGFPLGLGFGLVLSFLEGRQSTEALAAGLCASFVVADGIVKSVGATLLERGVPEHWMPCLAGALFLAPYLACVWMLSRIPRPSAEDVRRRSERPPIDRAGRRTFLSRYARGLAPLTAMFFLVTILRSIRADFAPELWQELGVSGQPAIFTQSEMAVGLGVVAVNGSCVLIRNNRRAFFAALAIAISGFVLVLATLAARRWGGVGPFPFMVFLGLGLYLPYVAVHTTVFERLIAMTRERANVGFLLYVVDSVSYLGYIAVLLAHSAWRGDAGLLGHYQALCAALSVAAGLSVAAAWRFFSHCDRDSSLDGPEAHSESSEQQVAAK